VEAAVVKSYIDVEDVAVNEGSFVWNSVTDNFVRGRAYRLRKFAVV
jgi:hypothetical protein